MNTHAVTVHPRWVQHEVTQALRQRRAVRVEVNEALQHCDFACSASSVLYYDVHSAAVERDQAGVARRVQEARQRCGTQPVVLMVRVDAAVEPSLETLSWLNLECGVAQQCGLVLVWSVDDAVQFLSSLAASAVTSLEFSATSRTRVGDAPLPVLIDALTQTPQVVTRNDVVRIANRKTCMADVLLSEASEWEGIAGLGQKKAARLQHLFRTPFLSSKQKVGAFLQSGPAGTDVASPALAESLAASAVGPPEGATGDAGGRRRMMDALQRRRDEEDEEGGQ